MKDDDDMGEGVLSRLDAAFAGSTEPPPFFEAIEHHGPTGVPEEQLRAWRRDVQAGMIGSMGLGAILHRRRQAIGLDMEALSRRSRWPEPRIEALEEGNLDLNLVEASMMAVLLMALGIRSIGPIEQPLRTLAKEHLAVYQGGSGPLYGRSRKDVSQVERRRHLVRGVLPVDEEATASAAARYLRSVQQELDDLSR